MGRGGIEAWRYGAWSMGAGRGRHDASAHKDPEMPGCWVLGDQRPGFLPRCGRQVLDTCPHRTWRPAEPVADDMRRNASISYQSPDGAPFDWGTSISASVTANENRTTESTFIGLLRPCPLARLLTVQLVQLVPRARRVRVDEACC